MIQDVEFMEDKHIKVNHKNSLKRLEHILNEEYIDKSYEVVSKHRKIRNYFIKLVTPGMCDKCIKEFGADCEYIKEHSNLSLPYGNFNAKIMFANKIPTLIDCASLLSHYDSGGMLLISLLSFCGIKEEDCYFTDIVKCPNDNINTEAFSTCSVMNFLHEVDIVQPKILVFEDNQVLNSFANDGIFGSKLKDKQLKNGCVYNTKFLGKEIMLASIPNPNRMIYLNEQSLNQARNDLVINLKEIAKNVYNWYNSVIIAVKEEQ